MNEITYWKDNKAINRDVVCAFDKWVTYCAGRKGIGLLNGADLVIFYLQNDPYQRWMAMTVALFTETYRQIDQPVIQPVDNTRTGIDVV